MRTNRRLEVAAVALVVCLLTLSDAARAQLAVPGPSGVVMGHLHLTTKDMEASKRFWSALGGVPVQNGQLQLIQLPGTFVMLRESQQSTGGTEGSTVDRVVFRVRMSEMPQLTQRLEQATGSKFAALVTSPEGVTIELRGATAQEAAVIGWNASTSGQWRQPRHVIGMRRRSGPAPVRCRVPTRRFTSLSSQVCRCISGRQRPLLREPEVAVWITSGSR